VRRHAFRLAGSIAVVLALVFGTRAASRRILFPTHDLRRHEAGEGVVRHALWAADGASVHALELPAPHGARTVVHFHNNRETVEACLDFARALRARGLGVLLIEYRGYGVSAGLSPSEEGLYLDAEAGLEMLAARGIGPDRIVLSGMSLGTGVAAEMAGRKRGSRLVLVAPYTSIPDLVTDVAPFVPASALLADQFETLEKAPSIDLPTLVVHGDDDEIVPFWMGERLSEAIRGARLLRVNGGRHGDLLVRDRERILEAISALAGPDLPT
jgi:fermentation-respiration switch protein FrsA (DUF1100 family)